MKALTLPMACAFHVSLFLVMAVTAAAADETPAALPSARELFTDQPKGLSEQIAAWKFIYVGETFGNLSGGLRQGAIYEGTAKFGIGVNLDKLLGWEGASFYTNVLLPHGDSLTQKYTGDFNVLSNIDTHDSLRLYKLWLQQDLDDGKWSLRVGQIAADKECFVSDSSSLYFNNAFGTFPVFSANIPGPIFPLSAPGARVRWSPADDFSILAMVFSGDVGSATTNPHNTGWEFRSQNGALGLLELAYKSHQADGDTGLPGTFKLGAFYDSKSFGDPSNDGSHHGDHGMYVMADQSLYRDPLSGKDEPHGLNAFARAGVAPQADRNVVIFDGEAGLNYAGLFASRGKDITGLAFAFTRLGDAYARANDGSSRHEAIIELTQLMVMGNHFTLQPDVQYILNPGGLGFTRNAFAAGLRFTVYY